MSNYTTELRFICETFAGLTESEGYNSVNNVISKSRDKVFSFDYPIFDESYRPILETKIIKHYYTREICAETYGRWKLFLDSRMNEIMPKYNKLYESELLQFNPLYDADYTRSGNRLDENEGIETNGSTDKMTGTVKDVGQGTNNMTGTVGDDGRATNTMTGTIGDDGRTTNNMTGTVSDRGNNNSTRTDDTNTHTVSSPVAKGDTWMYYSDTPQGGVDGLEDNLYLTNATHTTQDTTGSTTTTDTDNTGTVTTETDTNNTKTYNTQNPTTSENTRTYNTQNPTTSTNTRTYNTQNPTTSENTRTYNTTDTRSGNKNTNLTSTQEYAEHVIGKFPGKSYSKLLTEFRETFLNIDQMVIRELGDLFFGLWE